MAMFVDDEARLSCGLQAWRLASWVINQPFRNTPKQRTKVNE